MDRNSAVLNWKGIEGFGFYCDIYAATAANDIVTVSMLSFLILILLSSCRHVRSTLFLSAKLSKNNVLPSE